MARMIESSSMHPDDTADIVLRHHFGYHRNWSAAPGSLRRHFDVFFKPATGTTPIKMREIRAKMIGKYVTFKGMCTRLTDVKPLMEVACYTCEGCGQEYFQEVTDTQFIPIQFCQSKTCNKNFALFIETRASKFAKYKELRIQELSEDVPVGHVPRSMSVTLIGDMTRKLSPGDIANISGIFLPRQSAGYSGSSSLVSTTYLYAMSVEPLK